MDQPIMRGGRWWHRLPDGSWLQWDDSSLSWRPSSFGPPPPPPPPSVSPPLETKRGISRNVAIGVVVLSVLAASLGAYWWVGKTAEDEPDSVSAPGGDGGIGGPGGVPGSDQPSGICASAMDPASAQAYVNAGGGDDVGAIALVVSKIRDLDIRKRIEPEFLTAKELKARVEESLDKDFSDVEADSTGRVLALLGAVPPDFDLKRESKKILGEQILGFYDPATKELVVRSSSKSGDLPAFDEVTLAHEIEHALADQSFGLGLEEDPSAAESDAALAERAVAEGDATLTMQMYMLQAMSFEEQADLLSDPQVANSGAGLEGAPHYIKESLVFPYTWGVEFVCDLYDRGGWAAVNRAYRKPPKSTAQIFFPDRYLDNEAPVRTSVDGDLALPWRSHPPFAVGVADLLWLFQAPGNDADLALADPLGNAGSLAGGRLVLWTDGPRSALSMSLVERPGADLCEPIISWHESAFPDTDPGEDGRVHTFVGEGRASRIDCSGTAVRLAIAPTPQLARRALGS